MIDEHNSEPLANALEGRTASPRVACFVIRIPWIGGTHGRGTPVRALAASKCELVLLLVACLYMCTSIPHYACS